MKRTVKRTVVLDYMINRMVQNLEGFLIGQGWNRHANYSVALNLMLLTVIYISFSNALNVKTVREIQLHFRDRDLSQQQLELWNAVLVQIKNVGLMDPERLWPSVHRHPLV